MGVIAVKLFALVSKVPWWLWAVMGLVLWGLSGHHDYKALKQEVVVKAAKSEQEQRDEEQRRVVEQAKAVDKVAAAAEGDKLDAERARAAERRLRAQLEVARARSEASASAASAAERKTAETVRVVLGECVARYRELGEEADRARRAGQACEVSYDVLVKGDK
jgi:hypothetical protein